MKCSKCGIDKDENQFRKRKNKKGELITVTQCKQCEKERYTLICKNCGKEFKTKHKEALYCNKACFSEYHRQGKIVECANCGKEIYRKPNRLNKNKYQYCSRKCQSTHRGSWYNGEEIYNFNPNKTKEQRVKERKGMDNTNFVKECLERDNYTCILCGLKGVRLEVHHIESFNSNVGLRYIKENGTTMCVSCHKKFHKEYGYGKNTKEQFIQFLKDNTEPSL